MSDKIYMNTDTGSVATLEEWDYCDEGGSNVAGVESLKNGKLTEVVQDAIGEWVEA